LSRLEVNNELYEGLGERWYCAKDDPVALLRAEARTRNPWMLDEIRSALGEGARDLLDIACGAGFVSNAMAAAGHRVTGVDLSEESLRVAERHDATSGVRYLKMDATKLEFAPESFDVVSAMDFLEHVEDPALAVAEAARVLRPGGLYFFSTFNRNLLSRLVVIWGVERFVRNTPERLHVYRYFLKPGEVAEFCRSSGMGEIRFRGLRPRLFNGSGVHLLRTGEVREDFSFKLGSSLAVGYVGFARKQKADRT
jgi:2-polyprenyl-6-hydroxyphenyl methylase/3-demethylubiquinone-9 3-methyltransferase